MKSFVRFFLLICLMAAVGCSVFRKQDPQKDIRDFLSSFEADLTKSDEQILSYFHMQQSNENMLSVIRILQNKDEFIHCEANVASAYITSDDKTIRVDVSAKLWMVNADLKDTTTEVLTLWLSKENEKLMIAQWNGEKLHQMFVGLKNKSEWDNEIRLAMEQREGIYKTAKQLEQKFDSVIWYATYAMQNFFYVAEGSWVNYFMDYENHTRQNINVKMGLIDAKGEIVIPIQYDLIGSIGFAAPNLVEVIQNKKVGYFDIRTKQMVVAPGYDFIVPYRQENVWALVKQDDSYGWLDHEFHYAAGFPSAEAERWFLNFEFLKQNIRLMPSSYAFCEIPAVSFAGSGIIVPPAYLSRNCIFDEIEGGISTTKVPINGWTEYKETHGSVLKTITDKVQALITSIQERYIEGREEFYSSNKVVFFDLQRDTLAVASIRGESVSMQAIDSTLIEVLAPVKFWFEEYGEEEQGEEYQLNNHSYFSITASGGVVPLKSNRLYPQTQFLKLDSARLKGSFVGYDFRLRKEVKKSFPSKKTLIDMRDEILASYGYRFPDEATEKRFLQRGNWYNPVYPKVEDFEDEMTVIDKYNLAFLNKILALLGASPLS